MRAWSDVFVIKGKPGSYTWPILDSGFTNTKYKQYLPPLSSPFWDASFLVHCMKQDDQFDKLLNSKWLFQECGGLYFYIPLSVYFGVRQVFVKRLQCWALDENVTDLFGVCSLSHFIHFDQMLYSTVSSPSNVAIFGE